MGTAHHLHPTGVRSCPNTNSFISFGFELYPVTLTQNTSRRNSIGETFSSSMNLFSHLFGIRYFVPDFMTLLNDSRARQLTMRTTDAKLKRFCFPSCDKKKQEIFKNGFNKTPKSPGSLAFRKSRF